MTSFKIRGKPALIIMHMQNWVVDKESKAGSELCSIVKESGIIPCQQSLLKAFHDRALPVVYANMTQPVSCTLPAYGYIWNPLDSMKFSPKDREIIPELAPQPGDIVLDHWLFGPFNNSGLDQVLRSCYVETLVLAGFASIGVVYSAAVEAADHYYSVIVPSDASVSPLAKAHEVVMEVMFPAISLVTTTKEVIAHL